jgi:hypothetical protein
MRPYIISCSSPSLWQDPQTGMAVESGNDELLGYVVPDDNGAWGIDPRQGHAYRFDNVDALEDVKLYFENEGEDLRLAKVYS